MRESTAEEYLKFFKAIAASARQAVSELSDTAGAQTKEERQAIVDGMSLVAPITLRNADGETVPLKILSGTLDWKKIFSAAKEGGIKNYFVEMDLPLMKASVPYLHQLQV